MFAEWFAILVEELSVRSLQSPGELGGVALAGVDLVALRMNLEKKLFVGGRLPTDLLRGHRERNDGARGREQRGESESANSIVHGRIPPVSTQFRCECNITQLTSSHKPEQRTTMRITGKRRPGALARRHSTGRW